MQSAPATLGILQVDRAPRNRKEQLDPVEGPRVLFDDGEVQHCPAEVVAAVDLGDDGSPVCETLCAAASSSAPSGGVGVGRLAQPGRRRSVAIVVAGAILTPSATAVASSSSCESSAATARTARGITATRSSRAGVDRAVQERASLCDRPRSIQCMEVDGRNVAHVLARVRGFVGRRKHPYLGFPSKPRYRLFKLDSLFEEIEGRRDGALVADTVAWIGLTRRFYWSGRGDGETRADFELRERGRVRSIHLFRCRGRVSISSQ